MRLPPRTYESALKILRLALLEITGLPQERVINALSVRGPDMAKILEDTSITVTPDLSDTFIIFEFQETSDDAFWSASYYEEHKSEVVMPYTMSVKVYGTKCVTLTNEILANLKTSYIAEKLRNSGVWIYNLSKPTSVNEFVNNTIWPRCDFDINVETRSIVETTTEGFVKSIDSATMIKNQEDKN